jgi:hypothetical protein
VPGICGYWADRQEHCHINDLGLLWQSIFNSANYVAAFEFNNDGHVDIADFGQFSILLVSPLPEKETLFCVRSARSG